MTDRTRGRPLGTDAPNREDRQASAITPEISPSVPAKQDAGLEAIDPRLIFLQRASARCILVEHEELPLDEAFGQLVEPFLTIIAPTECGICGLAPCQTPSFCTTCREADRKRKWRRR